MTFLPVNYVVIEGPDCSGKTSLYSNLNKATSYIRNIRDRSYLSTLCYARLYDRPAAEDLRNSLREELCDGNNFFIVLLPAKDVLIDRLSVRGDDFQDKDSLVRLHDIFEDEVKKISFLPNVLVIREELDRESLTSRALKSLNQYEQLTPSVFGSLSRMWTKLDEKAEVQFRARFNLPPEYSDVDCLEIEHEAQYFKEILSKCKEIISRETAGDNPYKTPQNLDTRRFYYSSDTCISSIHFLNRQGNLKVICQLRSTDSVGNGSPDLRFLSHLSTEIARFFSWKPSKILLDVSYNSLHVRNDKI
jgi:hypothetical protein